MPKKIISFIIILIGLYLIFSSGKSIIYLLSTGKKVDEAKDNLVKVQKENLNLKKQLQIVKSPEFLEKTAREKLNLTKDGETLVILPTTIPLLENEKKSPDHTPNWQKWYSLFF